MTASNGFKLGRMITKATAEKAEQRDFERFASGVGGTESSRPSRSRNPAKCANQYCNSWLSVGSKRLGRCEVCGEIISQPQPAL